MWKRDKAVRPTGGPTPVPPATTAAEPTGEPKRELEKDVVNIGKSVVIKGELSGSEDLTIEGQMEGKIELHQNVLTIGPNGRIKAEVFAKAVIVLGEVTGNVTATEKIDIRENGSVEGNLVAPRVAIAEGAHFRGSIDMQRTPGAPRAAQAAPAEGKPEARPAAMAAAAAPTSRSRPHQPGVGPMLPTSH